MVLADQQTPSDLGRHFPTVSSQQRIYRYVTDDIDRLVDNNDLLTTSPAAGADFTLLNGGLHGDPCPRVLVVTMVNAATGADRGLVVRLYGMTEFGPRSEPLDFGSRAGGTTWHMFTMHAYRYVTRVQLVSRNGAATPITLDRFDVGIVNTTATAAGTLVTTNGAAAFRFKGVGLPIPVTSGSTSQGAASADFESEILGCVLSEDGTSGVTTNTILTRGTTTDTNEMLVDNGYSVFVPAERFAASGAANTFIALELWINTRLRL